MSKKIQTINPDYVPMDSIHTEVDNMTIGDRMGQKGAYPADGSMGKKKKKKKGKK